MKRFIIALMIVISSVAILQARIINIPADYATIQAGINASINGDTVLVAPGIYVGNVNFNARNIILGSLYLTTGDTNYITQTMIERNFNGSVITFQNSEDSTAAITGFTIQHGSASGGGGIYCSNSYPTITHNIIQDNTTTTGGYGGGICCIGNSHPIISYNIIRANTALANYHEWMPHGGGIYCLNSNPQIMANNIDSNVSYGYMANLGSGIYIENSNSVVAGNTINGNIGNAVFCQGSSPYIFNNSIHDHPGDGIISYQNSNPLIVNNTIYRNNNGVYGAGSNAILLNNTITENGSGITSGSGSINASNTILWNNYAEYTLYEDGLINIVYSIIRGGHDGIGNIDSDPLFINITQGNFNVCAQSPGINAGDPQSPPDPDSTNADIGVYFDSHPQCQIGNRWFVSTLGNDTTGNGSIESPFRSIQHAINTAFQLDTIIVQNGTYGENISISRKSLVISSNYIFSGDSMDIRSTSIEAGFSAAINIEFCRYIYVIGLTITHTSGIEGEGILFISSGGEIRNNRIINNISLSHILRGGIYCLRSNPIISNNIISSNSSSRAMWGGGIGIEEGNNPIIEHNLVINNSADWGGGGIFCVNVPAPSINGNLIEGNISNGYGGAIAIWGGNPLISNNVITDNMSGGNGTIFSHHNNPVIINNVIWSNTADTGGAIYCKGNPSIINSIIRNNTAQAYPAIYTDSLSHPLVSYNNIQGGWSGEGNIDSDPLFRNPANGDFHLMSTSCGDAHNSPCIDTGDPSILDLFLDCQWGLGAERSDIGAYGGRDSMTTDIENPIAQIPQRLALLQNYPNPFNASTTVKYSIPQPSNVHIYIYNLLGQKVVTLFEGHQDAGEYSAIWNAAEIPSGVYFAKLISEKNSMSIKMMLLK